MYNVRHNIVIIHKVSIVATILRGNILKLSETDLLNGLMGVRPLPTWVLVWISLEPRRGGGEKSAWYPLFAHALNYNIKPRGFMQMTSQNFPSVNNDVYTTQRIHEDLIALTLGTWSVISAMRDETTMTTLWSRASFTSNMDGTS